MKKLIYSQEDLDLILSLETQEYEDKINNLQSKIDKAIEFVEKESKICYTNKTTNDPQKVIGNFMWHTDKLLNILKEDK